MMKTQQEIVSRTVQELREKGFCISDEEVREAKEHCLRKMEVAGKQDDYFELLFPDIVREYLFRGNVNAISLLRMMEDKDVQRMFEESVR